MKKVSVVFVVLFVAFLTVSAKEETVKNGSNLSSSLKQEFAKDAEGKNDGEQKTKDRLKSLIKKQLGESNIEKYKKATIYVKKIEEIKSVIETQEKQTALKNAVGESQQSTTQANSQLFTTLTHSIEKAKQNLAKVRQLMVSYFLVEGASKQRIGAQIEKTWSEVVFFLSEAKLSLEKILIQAKNERGEI